MSPLEAFPPCFWPVLRCILWRHLGRTSRKLWDQGLENFIEINELQNQSLVQVLEIRERKLKLESILISCHSFLNSFKHISTFVKGTQSVEKGDQRLASGVRRRESFYPKLREKLTSDLQNLQKFRDRKPVAVAVQRCKHSQKFHSYLLVIVGIDSGHVLS